MIVTLGGIAVVLAGSVVIIIAFRYFSYRRRIWFDPRQDWVLGLSGSITTISVDSDNGAILIPKEALDHVSALLEIRVRSSILGWLFDPSVEIRGSDYYDVQYFERGAVGSRFLNITRFLQTAESGGKVRLSGRNVRLFLTSPRLHLCSVGINDEDRVLVVAPHPDDAEIAAFGVYSKYRSIVLTVTAGDLSDRYYNERHCQLSRSTVAKFRVWDSLTIPRLGGVSDEQIINLCMPDGSLQEMSVNPDAESDSNDRTNYLHSNAVDFRALREMNRSPLVRGGAVRTWNALVDEIAEIIRASEPTIIITPHPKMDPHLDHQYATRAVCEAMHRVGPRSVVRTFLFSLVHNRRSELWPFGPAGAGISPSPIFASDGICGSGFYSHSLSPVKQEQKFLALEAMHDLREITWPTSLTFRSMCRRILRDVKALIQGTDVDPTSYLRRAVRPDEFFITASVKEAITLGEEVGSVQGVPSKRARKPQYAI